MMKILTICIPTYKRQDTLQRCIKSIVEQIEKYGLADKVDLHVADDCSPDSTKEVLEQFRHLSYFVGLTREKNLGMNVNIKVMLQALATRSHYHLIMTDDDYLQPDVLNDVIQFLSDQRENNPHVSVMWTPRYSYTEDGQLHDIVCASFTDSAYIQPSVHNAGRYMNDGFVLSGLIVRAEKIDYRFWEKYNQNAYFPVIFTGDLLRCDGGYYWNKNIAFHTVLNPCHWESWGNTDVMIHLRQAADFVNSYGILATRFARFRDRALFYLSARHAIALEMTTLMLSEDLAAHRVMAREALYKLREQGILKFTLPLKFLALFGFLSSTVAILMKCLVFGAGAQLAPKHMKINFNKRFQLYKKALGNSGVVAQVTIS